MLRGKICNKTDFDAGWFQPWRPMMAQHTANNIRLGGPHLHRKEWELVFVCQVLEERGLLQPGKRGVGLAVGLEPLPAIFVSRGCKILATDKSSDSGGHWQGQWASGKSDLSRPQLCDSTLLEANLDFQQVDMNDIPSHLHGFDFSWSCCALEHLGSLNKGLQFLINQMELLKPGGTAVHTTEFNLSSNGPTLTRGETVAYRRRDAEKLEKLARLRGHSMDPVDFSQGNDPLDRFIASPPWDDTTLNLAHLRLKIGPYVCTSMGLIMTKGAAATTPGLLGRLKERLQLLLGN